MKQNRFYANLADPTAAEAIYEIEGNARIIERRRNSSYRKIKGTTQKSGDIEFNPWYNTKSLK